MPFKGTGHGNGMADGAVTKLLQLWQHASALWRHAVLICIVTSHKAWMGYEYSLQNMNRPRAIHKHDPHPLETMRRVWWYSENARVCAKWQWNVRDCVTGLHDWPSRECNPVTPVECVSLSFQFSSVQFYSGSRPWVWASISRSLGPGSCSYSFRLCNGQQ